MGKLLDFFRESNRWKHLLFGCLIGIGSDDPYCAAYVGIGVASALEFKDKAVSDFDGFKVDVKDDDINYAVNYTLFLL